MVGGKGTEAVQAITYREARIDDAAAIGALHVAAWRETYTGLLPDAFLDSLSADERSETWRAVLSDPAAYDATALFLAESDGRLAGFGACSDQRDPALEARGFDGEFGAVYVLRAFQRKGAGRALMRLMARDLLERGCNGASLWVLRENRPARRFYERLGGLDCGEKTDERPGLTLHEIAYGWKDLSLLIGDPPSILA